MVGLGQADGAFWTGYGGVRRSTTEYDGGPMVATRSQNLRKTKVSGPQGLQILRKTKVSGPRDDYKVQTLSRERSLVMPPRPLRSAILAPPRAPVSFGSPSLTSRDTGSVGDGAALCTKPPSTGFAASPS